MQTPKLAIIIPCYNEELCVESTCKRLLEVLKDLIDKSPMKFNQKEQNQAQQMKINLYDFVKRCLSKNVYQKYR